MRLRSLRTILACVVFGLAVPAQAEEAQVHNNIGSEKSPWGLRLGVGTEPDQIVVGVNFLETKIDDNLFIVPDAEIGFGDDALVLSGVAGVHYRFVVDANLRPYAGGGLSVGFIDYDRSNNDSTSVEIGIRGTGGIIWRLKGGSEMFAELNLIVGDLYDAQVLVGWRF